VIGFPGLISKNDHYQTEIGRLQPGRLADRRHFFRKSFSGLVILAVQSQKVCFGSIFSFHLKKLTNHCCWFGKDCSHKSSGKRI